MALSQLSGLPTFCSLFAILFMTLTNAQSIDNQKPPMKGLEARTAILYPNSIKGNDAKKRDYNLETKKGDANAKLSGGSKVYDANAANNRATGTGAGGKQVVGTKIGSGGTYETPKNKGSYRNSQQGNDKVVNLESNARTKMDVKDVGKEQDFKAVGNKHNYETDPNDNNFRQGQIKMDSKPYDYTINKGSDGKNTATLADSSQKSIFVGTKKYSCVGQSDGISNCADEWGRKVGEVRGNKQGDVTVTNNLGIPIASGKVAKDQTGKKTATVNGGLFNAESVKQTQSSCPGFTNDKVKISKPMTFRMANQRTVDGATRWDWPACFDCSIQVTLGPNVLGKNLALKWIPLVLPAGRLNCQDPATIACGSNPGECYYCDMCDPVKQAKVTILGNGRSNICEAKGGQTFTATATICPPPEANMANYCDRFSKGLGDPYWQKKGNLDVTFEVYNRKSDQDFASVKADRVKYNQLLSDFKKANPKYLLSFSVPDSEVSNWYKTTQAEKIGCTQSIINYNLGGSKANTALLFEAASAASAFERNPCPAPRAK